MDYKYLLSTLCAKQWGAIGLERRSGVAVPLFSVYSANSIGIGELPDLKLLVDWCKITGMSIIQLLPLNDVGFNFRPYDAQSTFALEPMYLSLDNLIAADLTIFKNDIKSLRKKFTAGRKRVNYKIKQAKLELLWKIFKGNQKRTTAFNSYVEDNKFWLEDYALFKVIKEKESEKNWGDWNIKLKQRNVQALKIFKKNNLERIEFHKWLQWQLFEQFKIIKQYVETKKIFLMGDLPFLVSGDSADVWSHQDYFKLGLCAGAPPDMYFAKGQRWGMPVYNWDNIAKNGYDYIRERLSYAQNFYDLFRIDHVVGIFRAWAIPAAEPLGTAGLNGAFDPQNENLWEGQGRKILSIMATSTKMLACAEDLGVVPECSYRVLEEFGIPGIEVQRWTKYWGRSYDFKAPQDYRKNSVATLATHDSSLFCSWWQYESETVDGELFKRKCLQAGIAFESVKSKLFDLDNSFHGRLRWRPEINSLDILLEILKYSENQASELVTLYKESYGERKKFWDYLGIPNAANQGGYSREARRDAKAVTTFGMGNKFQKDCSNELLRLALEKINCAASIFSIQLLQDWLSIDCLYDCNIWELRINFPGTLSDKNWSLVTSLSLEEILTLPINNVIKNINYKAGRI